MTAISADDMTCGHGKDLMRENCEGCDRVWLSMMLERIERDLLWQKRRAFDLGEHDCHIKLSNAESECRAAIKALAPTPPLTAEEKK